MATFQAFNAAGIGFNMSSTSSSGWSFVGAHPDISTDLINDTGSFVEYDVYGSDQIDYFSATYQADDDGITLYDLTYENDGDVILSIKDLNLYTSMDDLQANAWFVTVNQGHDTFYGNDYDDVIRAGNGDDAVYAYDGDDILYGDAGDDDLYGVQGSDDLYGGLGRDILSGGSGSDYLNGGAGVDRLIGGTGKDYFVFDTRPSRTNVDWIDDFRPSDDTIMLDNRIFTKVGRDGWLAGSAFTIGTKAKDASDRIIYNKQTGDLLYDPDGVGGAAAVKFAHVKAGLPITKADFFVL
jgi:Ca2+-binding RTX toxin-like protein